MNTLRRHSFGFATRPLVTAAMLAAGIGGVSSSAAYAQSAPAAPKAATDAPQADVAPADGDIIVTAQRRAQRLQEVPIAITAVGADDLQRRSVKDLSDIRGAVPSLVISTPAAANSSNQISLRGVSGQLLPIGGSQATAVYLDGVFLSRPDAAFFALDDIERIEVLRGPQGTLYGRNATSGAVNIVTSNPTSDEVRGSINASYGNFDAVSLRGSLNLPIANGLAAGISAAYDQRDGYLTNALTGNKVGDQNSATARIKLRYDASSDFDATLSADYSRRRSDDFFRNLISGGVYIGAGNPDVIASRFENRTRNDSNNGGVSLLMNIKPADGLTVTSVTSWRTIETINAYELDGFFPTSIFSTASVRSSTFNQEVRALYSSGSLDLTVGANYYHETGRFFPEVNPPTKPGDHPSPLSRSNLDAYAGFAQLEYRIIPEITLIGGLRLNHEQRNFSQDYTRALPVAGTLRVGNLSATKLLPMAGINFTPSRDILIYAKYSQGYQAPGFNPAPGVAANVNTFGAESLAAYELGWKTQFFDRALTFNGAAFYYDYSNLQVRSQITPGVLGITNDASARVKGVELELSVNPLEGLRISGNVTYSSAKYKAYCEAISAAAPISADPLCAPGIADRSGNRLPYAPRWTGGANIEYEIPLGGDRSLRLGAQYVFASKTFFSPANEAVRNDGWGELGARADLELGNGLSVYAFGRNLTDKRYVGYAIRVNPSLVFGSLNEPRTYGLGVRYRF